MSNEVKAEQNIQPIKFKFEIVEFAYFIGMIFTLWLYYVLRIWNPAILVSLVMAVASYFTNKRRFFCPTLFIFVSLGVSELLWSIPHFSLGAWPFEFFVVAIAGWLACRKFDSNQFIAKFFKKLGRPEIFSILIITIPSLIALILYYRFHLEIAQQFPKLPVPQWSIPFVIVAIAVINGFREELMYRVLLQKYLLNSFSVPMAILIQALAFGFLHYKGGFPAGSLGVVLTTLFGAALGVQYYLTRSVAVIWFTHSIVDLIMFVIILYVK